MLRRSSGSGPRIGTAPTWTISLLHATYRAGHSALAIRAEWLRSACEPARVEHIFAMDSDDSLVALTYDCRRAINAPMMDGPSAVRNWNAAAAVASGDLLFVIADDLHPPKHWDKQLSLLIRNLDPRHVPFALKVSDSDDPTDTLLRHPVVSRAFYSRLGLFSGDLRSMYADDDISLRAFWKAAIIDGRRIHCEHRHPTYRDVQWSESQVRMNRPIEYQHGRELFEQKWTWRERNSARLLVKHRRPLSSRQLCYASARNRLLARLVFYPLRCARAAWSRLKRGRKANGRIIV